MSLLRWISGDKVEEKEKDIEHLEFPTEFTAGSVKKNLAEQDKEYLSQQRQKIMERITNIGSYRTTITDALSLSLMRILCEELQSRGFKYEINVISYDWNTPIYNILIWC